MVAHFYVATRRKNRTARDAKKGKSRPSILPLLPRKGEEKKRKAKRREKQNAGRMPQTRQRKKKRDRFTEEKAISLPDSSEGEKESEQHLKRRRGRRNVHKK